MNRSNPFALGTPSIFIINSPFQALCMLEAIEIFEITDYKVYLVLYEDKRNKQLFELLDRENIVYQVIDGTTISIYSYLSLLLPINPTTHYQRAFIGYYNTDMFYYIALKNIRQRSNLIYLDDGNATIPLITGAFQRSLGGMLVYCFFTFIAFLRQISINNLFTIYNGLKSPKLNIYTYSFQKMNRNEKDTCNEHIYFVGTNTPVFCDCMNISLVKYESSIELFLNEVKALYPNKQIIFIPHGRDITDINKNICNKLNIEYIPLQTTIELFILEQPSNPLAVYGFSSSALFNIKKMIPSTSVFNVVFSHIKDMEDSTYYDIAKYYEANDITSIFLNTQKSLELD